jgi:enamine deaminase RidA (YjgF/YER057c/UK114 family)
MNENTVEERLAGMGLELPAASGPPPGARIRMTPARRVGNMVYLSGNGPLRDGQVMCRGKLGREVTVEQGYEAAQLTALNLIAVLKAEIGDLEQVAAWVKLLGFINSAPGFNDQPAVLNGASDLILDAFGDEVGTHARSAVGMAELPWDICVEIEAIVELRG